MRVLILSAALFACACAAPSGLAKAVAPVLVAPVSPLLIAKTAIPAVPAGDIEAAAIDAKVKADDLTQAAIDQAALATQEAIEAQNEKINESNDQIREKSLEAFWSAEDKKWQALNAIQTAQAQIDGAVASNAPAIAKSAVGGVIIPQFVAPISAPVAINPLAPVVYNPGFVTAAVKAAFPEGPAQPAAAPAEQPQPAEEAQPQMQGEYTVKSAETEQKPVEESVKSAELKVEEKPSESAPGAPTANLKTSEPSAEKNSFELTQTHPVSGAIGGGPVVAGPVLAGPVVASFAPGLKLVNPWPVAVPYIPQPVGFVKTAW